MPKLMLKPTEMAELLQVSDRHLRRLTTDGVLKATTRGYDVLATVAAYMRYLKRDADGRQARLELARVESARKRLQLRRQLGHLFSPDEFVAASDRQFELQWEGWMRGGGWMYQELTQVLPPEKAYEVANRIDMAVKHELIEARDAWRKKWTELAAAAKDQQRVDNLLRELVEPGGDA